MGDNQGVDTPPSDEDLPSDDDNQDQDDVKTLKAENERLKSQNEDIIRSRQQWKDKARDFESRLSNLEKKPGSDDQKPSKEREQAWVEERNALQSQIEELKTEKLGQKVRDEIFKYADQMVDPNDVYDLLAPKLEVDSDDDGTLQVHAKGKPWVSAEEVIKEFLSNKPHLARNTRAKGSDTSGPGKKSSNTDYSYEQLDQMGKSEFQALARKNPELAKRYLEKT